MKRLILPFLISLFLIIQDTVFAAPTRRYDEFSLHMGTALHETGDNVAFCLASNRDLFCISKSGTGTNSTEVHVLSATSQYQEFSLHTRTALHETGNSFAFCLAPNRDLYAISKSGTGTKSTELHVLSASSNYQEFTLHTGTALHETGDDATFCLAENRDLFFISKSGTGTKSTEVHVLSAASNYQQFSLHTGTALHETGNSFNFCLAPNRDLYAISKSGTGTKFTEVHVLSASSNYQDFILHTGTPLHETGNSFTFCLALNLDLYGISKYGTGTHSTELHVLSGIEKPLTHLEGKTHEGWKEITYFLDAYACKSPSYIYESIDEKRFHIPTEPPHQLVKVDCVVTSNNGNHNEHQDSFDTATRAVVLTVKARNHQDSGCILVNYGPRAWRGGTAHILCKVWVGEPSAPTRSEEEENQEIEKAVKEAVEKKKKKSQEAMKKEEEEEKSEQETDEGAEETSSYFEKFKKKKQKELIERKNKAYDFKADSSEASDDLLDGDFVLISK